MWTLAIVFERQKTSAEGHSQTLTQSDLVFINPGIYINTRNLELLIIVILDIRFLFITGHLVIIPIDFYFPG